ncbi:MAG TPA: FAD/NAD(P)-binding protein [Candidatus Nanoarchaeia archaeon]|nr:FAD/NAD(P)-binding protein [Candidatus Nanoarchaeia archaeon]
MQIQKTKLSQKKENPFVPKEYKVLDFFRETSDIFTLTVNMKLNHQPGQFVQVSMPGFGEAPISICSDSKDFIKLNIREVGNVTKALSKLRKNGTILIRGPYGKGYPMEKLKDNNLIIIGGGCGVAPLKGIIDYVENHRKDYEDVHMFLGYRSPDDIIFKRELETWKKVYNIHVTVDKNAHGQFCYDAKEGFITDVLKQSNLTNQNKVAFICGPPVMMKGVIEILKQKDFHDDQIFISAERLMYCAIGICCHCMIRGKFTCIDGPVFRYDEVKDFKND